MTGPRTYDDWKTTDPRDEPEEKPERDPDEWRDQRMEEDF